MLLLKRFLIFNSGRGQNPLLPAKKMTNYLLIGSFVLIPFAILAREIIHVGQEFAFILSAVVLAGSLLPNRWAKIFIFYFVIWQLILLIRAFFNVGDYQAEAALGTLLFLLSATIIFIITYSAKFPNETFYKFICIAAFIQADLAILQKFGTDIPYKLISLFTPVERGLGEYAAVGTLGNSNFLAAFLAISLPFFFRPNWFRALPHIFLGLMVSNAATANVAAAIGIGYFFFGAKGAGILAFLAAIYLICVKGISMDSERLSWWVKAVREICQSWKTIIFGRGPGASWLSPDPRIYEAIHNEYVSTFYQYGLLGLVFLIGFLKTLLTGNRILVTALVIASVNCLGNFPLHLAPSTFLIVLIVGMIERERIDRRLSLGPT